jgi:hypothetical protein
VRIASDGGANNADRLTKPCSCPFERLGIIPSIFRVKQGYRISIRGVSGRYQSNRRVAPESEDDCELIQCPLFQNRVCVLYILFTFLP